MNDVEYWRNAYVRTCDRCRRLWIIRMGLELYETVGPGHIAESLRQLDAQGLFSDIVRTTVAKVFAEEFGRASDETLLARPH